MLKCGVKRKIYFCSSKMKTKVFTYFITIAILGGIFTFMWVSLRDSLKIEPENPIVFSDKTMLRELWGAYKTEYIEPDTYRTLDKQRDYITTSEGQSYTMFRAVLQDDKDTFDKSWKWTKDILKRKEDNLFSWLFGERKDGTYGVLVDEGGYNSATDGDTDIALALLFAYGRWNDFEYFRQAKLIIGDIWDKSVITINGKPYLLANNLEKNSVNANALMNPSYLTPYAYRIFARVDLDNPWMQLVDTSYEVLTKSTESKLDKDSSAYLPPDWIYINKTTGELTTEGLTSSLTTNFSYDAMRTVWRVALDWRWYRDQRAYSYLKSLDFLSDQWANNGMLYSSYSHDGKPLTNYQSHAMYATTIGYFMNINTTYGRDIYNKQLKPLYSPDKQSWVETLSYYDDNWVWFGMALYVDEIPNLADKII
jgi:endoglucanase